MSDTIIITALIVLLVPFLYFIKSYIKWKQRADIVNKIPGPKTYPIFGTTFELLLVSREDIFDKFQERIDKFSPIFRTWLGIFPEVHITRAHHMEPILSSTTLIQKGYVYTFLHPWLGSGLLTSTGSLWHKRRKLITPAFHFKILENFVDVFTEKADLLVKHLEHLADGRVIDMCPIITRCALDIICKTAMGVEVNALEEKNSDYVQAIYDVGEIILKRSVKPWLIADFIFHRTRHGKRFQECLNILHGFTKKVIKERKEQFKNKDLHKSNEEDLALGQKKKMAFLDLLLEASQKGANLSDTDIREEVDTFMFEGHDTTTASITWTLFLLGHHPDVQDKVVEELEKILGKNDGQVTFQDLNEMKYLERVIKESLRLYPSVPAIMRQTTESFKVGEYVVPAGCVLALHIYQLHRDPVQFPNPTQFDPDNFLPERCQNRHPFAYVPFSAGPRNCIGQKFALLEEKAVLSAIIRKYRVSSVEQISDIKYYFEMIMRSQTGIKVKLTPRY